MTDEPVFNLAWDGDNPAAVDVAEKLVESWGQTGQPAVNRAVDLIQGRDSAQWPNWYFDLQAMSEHWPEQTFTAERRHDGAGEHVAGYFQNGRGYQVCLRPPAFNPSLLQSDGDRPDFVAHVQYRFVDVPEESGALPWKSQVLQDHPVTQDNRERLNHEVTFLFGSMEPPRELPSSGDKCIHDGNDKGPHGHAVAWTWQYEIPAASDDPYTGFAGYCGDCLTESYGIVIDQVKEIFGLG